MPARLNLFSPLPPVHSEVGNHTLTVAAALARLADVTLWTPQAEPPVLEMHDGTVLDLPVVQFDPARMDWPRLNRADAQVYNIGNNATFHRAIFDVARRAPGIVVLHDTRLQHFFARYAEAGEAEVGGAEAGGAEAGEAEAGEAGRAFYLNAMRRGHGPAAMAEAERWLAGELPLDVLVDRYAMTATAADVALAAIVHNREECRSLAAQTRTPVFTLPLADTAKPLEERPPRDSTLHLVIFGFLGPNRRLGPILDVIAALPDQDVRLDIYGAVDEPVPIDSQITTLGLGGRVRRHGFVADHELRAALARADLAINLRYPSMGEASASQLRIWNAALPSVVTRTGWYATLPEDSVLFVEPEREAETLRAHLAALRRDPDRFAGVGLRGRAVLEQQHTPLGYASGLLEVVAQMPALHARRQAIDLSRRAAQAMLELTEMDGIALCADQVAEAVTALTRR